MLNLLELPVLLFPYVMLTCYEDTPLWLWWIIIPLCHANWPIPDRWPLHPALFPALLSYSTTATTTVDTSEAVQMPSMYHCHPPPPYWWHSYPGSETSPSLSLFSVLPCSTTINASKAVQIPSQYHCYPLPPCPTDTHTQEGFSIMSPSTTINTSEALQTPG